VSIGHTVQPFELANCCHSNDKDISDPAINFIEAKADMTHIDEFESIYHYDIGSTKDFFHLTE
jgi:hypothetical protein